VLPSRSLRRPGMGSCVVTNRRLFLSANNLAVYTTLKNALSSPTDPAPRGLDFGRDRFRLLRYVPHEAAEQQASSLERTPILRCGHAFPELFCLWRDDADRWHKSVSANLAAVFGIAVFLLAAYAAVFAP
jgi:hypothetical protein